MGPLDSLKTLPEATWTELEERVFALSLLTRYDELHDAMTTAWPESEEYVDLILDDLLAVRDDMDAENLTAKQAGESLTGQNLEDEDAVLARRLTRLLEVPALARIARARTVLSATPRRVNGVRLSTEVRPVSDRYDLGDVCVLVHDLRLTFDVDGRTSSLNLTLDPSALRDLWRELVNALALEDQLRLKLKGVLDVFDPEGQPGTAPGHPAAEAEARREAASGASNRDAGDST